MKLVPVFIFILALGILISCRHPGSEPAISLRDFSNDTIQLVNHFCGKCHGVPSPDLLDKNSWSRSVLPNMAARLGFKSNSYNPIARLDMLEQTLIQNAKVYAESPMVTAHDWQRIQTWYESHAPDSLIIPQIKTTAQTLFDVIPLGDRIQSPMVTLLNADTISKKIKVGLENGIIYSYDLQFSVKDTFNLKTTPIDYYTDQENEYILCVGILYPSEQKLGSLIRLNKSNPQVLVRDLHRPVHFLFTDFGHEHPGNVLISDFGYETGELISYKFSHQDLDPKPVIWSTLPGAVKTCRADVDGDGKQEMIALFSQGNEHVSVFDDSMKENVILRFPPVHGSCDLDVADMNGDGHPDLILSNGDNADYTPVIKPYHGISIYLNRGHYEFQKSDFIAYPGVLHSVVEDFDLDGDEDILSTSYFPGDAMHRYPALILFESIHGSYQAKTFKQGNFGKWMTVYKMDVDQDGDQDILLGSFLLNQFLLEGKREDWRKHGLMLLKNKKIKSLK